MKAAIYARISTSDGRQDADNQVRELRQFAGAQQWEIVGEYIDHESGGKADRAEFRRMFADAAQRTFDVIVFWALDRLTREGALKTLQYLNQLSGYGIAYRSFREPYLDSCGAFSDTVIAILGAMAKQERARISERVRAGLNRVRLHGSRSGKKPGRPQAVFPRDKAIELRNSGLSWSQIASKLKVGMTTVRRACRGGSGPGQDPQGGAL
jgi:DNA invertase Pin-like site-specific DNA recombinase